jgi:predicted ABC-type transport system involved in lysophospholipase L1 biosynthesis ATPase subunit
MENVAMPGWIGKMDRDEALARRRAAIRAGVQAREAALSQPAFRREQQRVAIARALAEPCFVPGGRADGEPRLETSEKVFDLMRECHNQRGLTSVYRDAQP